MTLIVLQANQALALNNFLEEMDDGTFPGEVDSVMISVTAQLGASQGAVSSMSMDIRLFWLEFEKQVSVEAKGEILTRNMIEFLFEKACDNFSEKFKSETAIAGFIARNLDILQFPLSKDEALETIYGQMTATLVGDYLKATQYAGVDDTFVRQFSKDYDPLKSYRQVATDLVDWLEAKSVSLADGYTFEGLRSGISSIKDSRNELLYFFSAMALGNPESNPAYKLFAKRILIAEQALDLASRFPTNEQR